MNKWEVIRESISPPILWDIYGKWKELNESGDKIGVMPQQIAIQIPSSVAVGKYLTIGHVTREGRIVQAATIMEEELQVSIKLKPRSYDATPYKGDAPSLSENQKLTGNEPRLSKNQKPPD